MNLHIIGGDHAGDSLRESEVAGEVLVWRDILYDGRRNPGWPGEETLLRRAGFLEQVTGGGLSRTTVLETLRDQYRALAEAGGFDHIILWFDACLFDQAMLAHILSCLLHLRHTQVSLICVASYPGIVPFHGLGQLDAKQLASLFAERQSVAEAQYRYALLVEEAFARQDMGALAQLARQTEAPLPWVPAAAARWLAEQPDPVSGLGRLESFALQAIGRGCERPPEIYREVAASDSPPQFWGDTTLWAVINGLADRRPPLIRIEGPQSRLPQWQGADILGKFKIYKV